MVVTTNDIGNNDENYLRIWKKLFEGTSSLFSISDRKTKYVNQIKKIIFMYKSQIYINLKDPNNPCDFYAKQGKNNDLIIKSILLIVG